MALADSCANIGWSYEFEVRDQAVIGIWSIHCSQRMGGMGGSRSERVGGRREGSSKGCSFSSVDPVLITRVSQLQLCQRYNTESVSCTVHMEL